MKARFPHRLRWYQFSLRALLLFVTFWSVLFAWWGAKARRQHRAVAAITAAGGHVAYEKARGLSSLVPAWLRGALGDDFFVPVHSVSLSDIRASDSILEQLVDLPRLERLWLSGSRFTDAGLRHVSGLTDLWDLNLSCTSLTDAGLERLEGLTSLRCVNLSDTRVTNDGVRRVIRHWRNLL
jgi:hypothetical protein